MMTSNQLDFHYNGTNDFGLGFDIVTKKGANFGPREEELFLGAGITELRLADPKAKLVCLIMTQHTPTRMVILQIRSQI